MMRMDILVTAFVAAGLGNMAVMAERNADSPAFLKAKTVFQTNSSYDPRLAIAVDGVIVHQHGAKPDDLRKSIGSWKDKGFIVGRMFFADSDATNEYWTGKWDGKPHEDEVERDARGQVIQCSGVRPYMLPTNGWTRYLQQMARESILAGADAVLPEEPLAHAHTGYEAAFKALWEKRYGRPWQPENSSPVARFLTAQLKNELYIELERELGRTVRDEAAKVGRSIAFVFPVHSMYSNLAAHLVAPLGTSLATPTIDGYIGQVWTGPVNWALANYDSPDKSFFASAYVLYDYFTELTRGTDRKLWMLIDPVEDDPRHTWAEFEEWYCRSAVAALMFPGFDAFEVMPWPDRIFLPGHQTGGGTPAPERFRIITLSIVQAQQEVPVEGEWMSDVCERPTEGIGVAMADTLLWHRLEPPLLQGIYGMFLPLVNRGIPVSACLLERAMEPGYLERFKVIVLSYEDMKPLDLKVNTALADWVRRGGRLIVLGSGGNLTDESFWWTKLGTNDPLVHLLENELGIEGMKDADLPVDKGRVWRRRTSARRFADPVVAKAEYLPLIEQAFRSADHSAKPAAPAGFCMKRGPFIAAHALDRPLSIPGPLVDLLDPDFPVADKVELPPGKCGLYRKVGVPVDHGVPRVLHTSHRLMAEQYEGDTLRVTIKGPAETPAAARILTSGKRPVDITVTNMAGQSLKADTRQENSSLLVRFPNMPDGATLAIRWKS